MKIIDVLNNGKMTISFEVFPPKKEGNFEHVRGACEKIAALRPSFVSVTPRLLRVKMVMPSSRSSSLIAVERFDCDTYRL